MYSRVLFAATGAEVEAQGFLKKVGKAVNKVEKGVSESLKNRLSHVKVWGGIRYKNTNVPVVKIGYQAFSDSGLTSVTLLKGIKKIGDFAFTDCKKLESVSLTSTIESFGSMCFWGCTSLNKISAHVNHKDLCKMVDIFGSDCQMFTSENLDECPGISWVD